MNEPPRSVRVLHHRESDGWWSESPDVEGWLSLARTYPEGQRLAEESLRARLGEDVVFEHQVIDLS